MTPITPPISLIDKTDPLFPPLFRHMADPPKKIFAQGNIQKLFDISQEKSGGKILCVVGTRRHSNYGREATEKLIAGLAGYNICIVSGLALGIDSIAHRAALDAGLYTVAFPGSGLDPSVMYPREHRKLAKEILEKGGGLLSEFDPLQAATKWTFPCRNRLMAGVSHATLVIEAGLKSGTLITSKNATDYNRDVGTVPGSIFSGTSAGPHMLIRNGATPITCVDDLLEFLGFARKEGQSSLPLDYSSLGTLSDIEKKIMNIVVKGPCSKDSIIRELGINVQEVTAYISSLEIEGFLKEENGMVRVA